MTIKSMTGYGNAQASSDNCTVTIEIRSVNSRYLETQFRMPDDLRMAEMPLRELVSLTLTRGKVDVRASYSRPQKSLSSVVEQRTLDDIQAVFEQVKQQLPNIQAPTFADVLQWTESEKNVSDPTRWVPLCLEAANEALSQLVQSREREGARLADLIKDQAMQAKDIVSALKAELPVLLQSQSNRLASRMREALDQASPEGLTHIRPEEISERLAAEANLFSLRADVAEELDRLNLHLDELQDSLATNDRSTVKPNTKSVGKRLDFLFQEMNREANTLGSKAVDIRLTRAAMDLKLLIEQMREQIQNIE